MKYRSLLLCLSILVMVFASCSSSQQSVDAQVMAAVEKALADEHARVADEAKAAEQAKATEDALAKAEQARVTAERALAAARQANSSEQARAAEEAKAKADAEHAKAVEDARIAAEQAKAAEDAAEQARAAAKQARVSAKKARVQTVTLAAGTPINVITSTEISTRTGHTGDRVTMILNQDISDGNRVIAQRGSNVRGLISESDPGGRVRGVATISLTLTGLTLADGNEISVTTNDHHVDAQSSVGRDMAKTGIGAGIGAAVGALVDGGRGAAIGAGIGSAAGAVSVLATHGDPAVIAPETAITFNLTAPLTITLQQDGGRR